MLKQFTVLEKKINFHSKISKENFVGLTHDNADYLASENNGLVGLIRKDFEKYFLDLPDPCHCLNLAVKSSLQELPSNVMDFIEQIHHFFAFPQRKAKLKMIQEEKGRRILLLKKYVGTRWLSLGQSLERLIIIWESLEDYMDFSLIKGKVAKKVKEKLKFFKECLKDPIFKCEILLLNFILNKVNALNVKLQDQNFKIGSLKTEMKLCFESIFELVCEAEKFHETPFSELLKIEWGSSQVREEWFLKEKDFIKKLSFKIHGNFETLTNLETDKKTKWISNYQNYISQLLAKFIKKMPFENEMLGIVDFLELKDKYVTLEQKLAKFNDMFQVVEKEELRNEVFSQLLRLRDTGFDFYCQNSMETSRNIWATIEKSKKYPALIKFAKLAQILPTSSADIEQAFSIIKLFKTEQRNSLSAESLEGCLLINQKYKGNFFFEI